MHYTWLHRLSGPSSLGWCCDTEMWHRSSAGLCHTTHWLLSLFHDGDLRSQRDEGQTLYFKICPSNFFKNSTLLTRYLLPAWGLCCSRSSSREVLTFGTLCIKQQVVEELNKAISYPLSYHYQLSTKHITQPQRDLKNNDTICLITCCIVNWLFWQ